MHPAHSNRPEHWSIKSRMTLMKFRLNESAVGVHPSSWNIRRQRYILVVAVSGTSSSCLPPDFGLHLWKIQTNSSVTVQLQDSRNLHFKWSVPKPSANMCQRKGCSKPQACFRKYLVWPRVSCGYRNPRIHCDKLANYLGFILYWKVFDINWFAFNKNTVL